MFERHFGLRENPFHSGHQMRFLYPSREHQEARAHLRYGIENREPFVLITGEVGTGKTTALYDALAEWGSKVSVALVTNSALTREEMIEEISLRFGLAPVTGASKPQALAQLERHLLAVRNRGEHAVLLLDEAQNLAPELLEEIRLLSNLEMQGEKLVQIFLVGQPELEAKLADPQLRQLRQRISVHYRLNPLSPEETAGYIHHRISVAGGNPWASFPPEACREVYRVTHGIPREINTVATQALITAYADGEPSVSPEHVKAVARENDFRSVLGGVAELPDGEMPMPPGAPPRPAPAPASAPEPAAVEAPVWSPPELEPSEPAPAAMSTPTPGRSSATSPPVDPQIDQVRLEELDAWSRAAQDLFEARRKTAVSAEPPKPVVEAVTFVPEARFPTPAELEERSAHADPASADLSGLPARLRQKIADDIARDERPNHAAPIALAAVAVIAIAIGLVLAQRFQLIDLPLLREVVRPAHVAVSTAAPAPVALPAPEVVKTPADSTSTVADTTRTQPRTAASPASVVAKPPATRPATVVAATTTASAKPVADAAAAPRTPPVIGTAKPAPAAAKPASAKADTLVFGIGVASYLDRPRAAEERDRLAALSGLTGLVVPFNNAGTIMFRVVMGRYPSNGAATRAANDFVEKYGVSEAEPLLISRAPAR